MFNAKIKKNSMNVSTVCLFVMTHGTHFWPKQYIKPLDCVCRYICDVLFKKKWNNCKFAVFKVAQSYLSITLKKHLAMILLPKYLEQHNPDRISGWMQAHWCIRCQPNAFPDLGM